MIPVRRTTTNWLPGFFNDFLVNELVERKNVSNPAVNILENENGFKVEVAAPGLSKEDFHIEIREDNHLVVSMEKKTENKEEVKEDRYLRRDFSYVSFRQSMILPDNVDAEKIEAKVENGVLSISIPKQKEEEKQKAPKQIQVN